MTCIHSMFIFLHLQWETDSPSEIHLVSSTGVTWRLKGHEDLDLPRKLHYNKFYFKHTYNSSWHYPHGTFHSAVHSEYNIFTFILTIYHWDKEIYLISNPVCQQERLSA